MEPHAEHIEHIKQAASRYLHQQTMESRSLQHLRYRLKYKKETDALQKQSTP